MHITADQRMTLDKWSSVNNAESLPNKTIHCFVAIEVYTARDKIEFKLSNDLAS